MQNAARDVHSFVFLQPKLWTLCWGGKNPQIFNTISGCGSGPTGGPRAAGSDPDAGRGADERRDELLTRHSRQEGQELAQAVSLLHQR